MAAPALTGQNGSNFTDASATETVGASLSWNTGDVILVVGVTEGNGVTISTPTVAGLTFAAVSGSPTNTVNTCKCYAFSATAASGGSGTITAGGSANEKGVYAFVYSGSAGVGTLASSATGTGTTVSLTRSGANSAVVYCGGDFGATIDTTVSPTPAGGTQRVAANDGTTNHYTAFVFSWADEGAAGSTSYGITGFTTASVYTKMAVEILGTADSIPILVMAAPIPT